MREDSVMKLVSFADTESRAKSHASVRLESGHMTDLEAASFARMIMYAGLHRRMI